MTVFSPSFPPSWKIKIIFLFARLGAASNWRCSIIGATMSRPKALSAKLPDLRKLRRVKYMVLLAFEVCVLESAGRY